MVRLTLELPDDLTRRAQQESDRRGVSLDLVLREHLCASLSEDQSTDPVPSDHPPEGHEPLQEDNLPPLTRSFTGCMGGSGVSEADYYRYVEEKHL